MSTFRFLAFGGACLSDAAGPIAGSAVQPRRLALLALLAASPTGRISRDKLAAYLWSDVAPDHARDLLVDSVYALRKALGKEVLLTRGQELCLNTEAVATDVGAFLAALERGDYAEAVELYTGPFLDGFSVRGAPPFEHWAESQREHLAGRYASALETVALEHEAAGSRNEALACWRRLAAHDPCSSRTSLRLMQALAAAGDRAAALQHARAHEAAVRSELDMEPDPEVLAFAEQLRRDWSYERDGGPEPSQGEPSLALPTGNGTPAARGNDGAADHSAAVVPGIEAVHAPLPGLARRMRWQRTAMLGLGAGLLLALALQGYRWYLGSDVPGVPPAVRSIAVLPLTNLSADPEQEYFADGMTDALITELARYEQLRVPSMAAVMRYKNSQLPLPGIAAALGVDAVITGTVARDGDVVRISTQLKHARTGEHLWADRYEGTLHDVIMLQRRVAQAIADGVRLTLMPEAAASLFPHHLPMPRAIDPLAYDYYLRGRNEWRLDYLEKAVEIEPEFADAYGWMAYMYAFMFSLDSSQSEYAEKGMTAVEKALSIDPDQPETLLARVTVLWTPAYGFQHAPLIEMLKKGIERNPRYVWYYFALAIIYMHIGLLEEARAELDRVATFAPGPWGFIEDGQILLYQLKPREALAAMRWKTPCPFMAHHRAWALSMLDRHAEAVALLDDALAQYPDDPDGLITSMQALLAASEGDSQRAEEKISLATTKQQASVSFRYAAYTIGAAYAVMGRPDAAVHWLRRAAEEGFPCYPLFARDPALDGIRDDPGFIAFLADLREEYEGYRAAFGSR
jgi:TolB-like protein/DNA-binding SARP family transcriptional activator